MSAKRHERTFARRAALQVLYQGDILDESTTTLIAEVRCLSEDGPLSDYARDLLRVVEEHKDEIDEHLRSTSENWSLGRMPVVDRSILRLATCEMMYIDDVPLSVSINEAVELAKDFGGEDDSPRFVNGVLGRIATILEEKTKTGNEPAGESESPAEAEVKGKSEPAVEAESEISAAAEFEATTEVEVAVEAERKVTAEAEVKATAEPAVEGERKDEASGE